MEREKDGCCWCFLQVRSFVFDSDFDTKNFLQSRERRTSSSISSSSTICTIAVKPNRQSDRAVTGLLSWPIHILHPTNLCNRQGQNAQNACSSSTSHRRPAIQYPNTISIRIPAINLDSFVACASRQPYTTVIPFGQRRAHQPSR